MGRQGPADVDRPFLALSVGISADDVVSVMLDIEGDLPERLFDDSAPSQATLTAPCNDERLLEAVVRLLSLSPTDPAFMGKHLKREIIFGLITGHQGKRFVWGIVQIQQAGDLYGINSWIKQNYKTTGACSDARPKKTCMRSATPSRGAGAVGSRGIPRAPRARCANDPLAPNARYVRRRSAYWHQIGVV